jgi:hypothetical protein
MECLGLILSFVVCGKKSRRPQSRRCAARLDPDFRKAPRRRGTACRPLFRVRHAERRVGQARHLVIAFTRSSGASHKKLRGWTRHSSLVTRHCPSQFVLGIDRAFVIEGKARGHKSSDRGRYRVGKGLDKPTILKSIMRVCFTNIGGHGYAFHY